MSDELEVVREGEAIRSIAFRPSGPDAEDDELRGYDPDHYDPSEGKLASLPGAELYRLVDSKEAAQLEQLVLECPIQWEGNHGSWGSHAAFLKHLLKRPRPALRLLELDGDTMPRALSRGDAVPQLSHLRLGQSGPAQIDVGDLSMLWTAAPDLEQLVVAQASKLKLGKVVAPKLRTLVMGNSAGPVLSAIARGSLPALETLIVRVARAKDVAMLLESKGLGPLRHLGLIADRTKNNRQGDAVIAALLASPQLEALETLDLGGWDASEAALRTLLAAAPRLSRLRELRLSSWRISLDELAEVVEEELLGEFKVRASRRGRPRDETIGRELEHALPVRWLTTTIEELEEREGRDVVQGYSSELSLDDWIEVERRAN